MFENVFVKLWWLSDYNDHGDAFCNVESIKYFIDDDHWYIYSDIVFCCDVSNYVAIDDGGELTSVHMDHVQKSTGWTTTVTRQAAALTQTWHGLHQIFGPWVYLHQLDSLQIKDKKS